MWTETAGRIDPTTLLRYPKPMKVSAQYAQEHFADILSAIDTGVEAEFTSFAAEVGLLCCQRHCECGA